MAFWGGKRDSQKRVFNWVWAHKRGKNFGTFQGVKPSQVKFPGVIPTILAKFTFGFKGRVKEGKKGVYNLKLAQILFKTLPGVFFKPQKKGRAKPKGGLLDFFFPNFLRTGERHGARVFFHIWVHLVGQFNSSLPSWSPGNFGFPNPRDKAGSPIFLLKLWEKGHFFGTVSNAWRGF